jgi:hypothetical protein
MRGALIALLFVALPAAGAFAAVRPSEPHSPFAETDLPASSGILDNPNFDLMVLEVVEVRGGGGLPMEATVRIEEVLRGRDWAGRTASARWGWDSLTPRNHGLPPPGTRLLAGVVSSKHRNESIQLTVVRAFEPSAANLETAHRSMAPPDPAPWLVLVVPVLAWALLALALQARRAPIRILLLAGALCGALATVALYLDYERRMSSYTTIRLDLYLVGPAVALALALPFAAARLMRRGNAPWRAAPDPPATTLYRPVGRAELALIEASGWREFPPRLPEQPIFYPVLNERYAVEIAEKWNTKDPASGFAGFVTRFRVRTDYLDRFEVHTVGAAHHQEYWIPAEELPALNRSIVGVIEVVGSFTE